MKLKNFVASVLCAAMAFSLVACTAKNDDKGTEDNQDLSADVVVLGAGGAGMSAAIEAADAGKSVIVLEKAGYVGGNTIRSTGGLNAAETDEQQSNTFGENAGVEKTLKAAEAYPDLADLAATVKSQYDAYEADGEKGYFDSVELFELDTLIGGQDINNHDLVKVLCSQAKDAVAWLKTIDGSLDSVGFLGGASVKRAHKPLVDGKAVAVGSFLVPVLKTAVENKGVELMLNTAATDLVMSDGKVSGVKATTKDGKEIVVNAKAVVIATGGFGANEEMYTSYRPELKGFVTTNAPTITGDGIKMAQAIGADTVDMEQIQIHPTVEQRTSALITEGLRGDGAILVNQEGKRFFDEVGTRDAVSAAELAQTGGYAYLIVDQAMVDASSVIAGYIKSGFTTQGNTYEELGTALGMDGATLAETMDKWNAAVAAKEDPEFGRTSFTNPLDTAPYYAIKIAPGVHHTMGGLKINTSAEVIDTNGNVIPGLFAAGEVTGGVHGANRLGGNAVADIVVFGRIAGQNAASYVAE